MPTTTPPPPVAPSLVAPPTDVPDGGTVGGRTWTLHHPEGARALAKARASLAEFFTYFEADVYTLQPIYVQGFGTVGVTRKRVMLVDPDVVAKWSREAFGFVLAHELGHLFGNHAERADAIPNCNRSLFNTAGDAEINDDLDRDPRAKWPWPPVTPASLKLAPGKLAEEYYAELLARPQPPTCKCACGGAAGNPSPGEEGAAGGMTPEERKALEDALDGVLGRTELQLVADRLATAAAIEAAEAKKAGSVPAGLLRHARRLNRPAQVRWQDQLSRAFRGELADRPGGKHPTYRALNRRMAGVGYGVGKPVLAATRDVQPRVLVAVDTSGSMSAESLGAGCNELLHLLRAYHCKATFLACDADVHVEVPVTQATDLTKLLHGGGGTSFVPIFERAVGLHPRPDLIVVYTDGYGSAPHTDPGIPTVWLLEGDHAAIPAPWGRVVRLTGLGG